MAGLCTLADVKTGAEIASGNTQHDATIQEYISDVTDLINQYCAPTKFTVDGAASTRYFTGELVDGELLIDDLSAAPTEIVYLDTAGATAATLTLPDDIVLLPRNRGATDPITGIAFRPSAPSPEGYEVAITGLWGWPVVPARVKAAAVETIRDWLRWNQPTQTQDTIGRPAGFLGRDLPPRAKEELKRIRGVRVREA